MAETEALISFHPPYAGAKNRLPAVYVPAGPDMTPNQIRDFQDDLRDVADFYGYEPMIVVLPPGSKVGHACATPREGGLCGCSEDDDSPAKCCTRLNCDC